MRKPLFTIAAILTGLLLIVPLTGCEKEPEEHIPTYEELQAAQIETGEILDELDLFCDSQINTRENCVEVFVTDSKLFDETLQSANVQLPSYVVPIVIYEPLYEAGFDLYFDDSIYFPRLKMRSGSYMQALLTGELTLKDGYLCIGDNIIIWQADYFLHNNNGTIEVLDRDGEVVARVGEEVVMGGGGISLELANRMIKEPLPEDCPYNPWLQGAETKLKLNTENNVSHTSIPTGDTPTEQGAGDDIVIVPGGGPAYRANVHEEGSEITFAAIEIAETYLGTGEDEAHIYYRNYIETAPGETRNNIIKVITPDKEISSFLLYADNIPDGITITDGTRWSGPRSAACVLVIETDRDIVSGKYPLEIGLIINNQDYGTVTCTVSVIGQSLDAIGFERAKPYLVIGEGNLANDDPSRSAGLWYITAEAASDFEERAQTVAQAAIDLYCLYGNKFTSVMLIPQDDVKIAYASAGFAVDGKGADGMTGSAPAAEFYWKIWTSANPDFTEQELAIAELWFAKQQDFPQKDPLSSLSYDEQALRQYIADTLNISYEEVQLPDLEMSEYELEQSLIELSVFLADNYKHGKPKTETSLGSLTNSKGLDASEKSVVNSMVNEIPEEIIGEFSAKYEAAEEAAQDPYWMVFSSWRPYSRSDEYRQLLEFCREQGETIWPLIMQQLDSEESYFAAGLIIDITIPEYLYYFKNTARQSDPQYAGGDIIAYVRELLALRQGEHLEK